MEGFRIEDVNKLKTCTRTHDSWSLFWFFHFKIYNVYRLINQYFSFNTLYILLITVPSSIKTTIQNPQIGAPGQKKNRKKNLWVSLLPSSPAFWQGFFLIICTLGLHPKPTLAIIRHYKFDDTLCPSALAPKIIKLILSHTSNLNFKGKKKCFLYLFLTLLTI